MRIINILLLSVVALAVNATDKLEFRTPEEKSTVLFIKALNRADGSDEQIDLLLKSVAMDRENRLALKLLVRSMSTSELKAKFAPQLLEIAKESGDVMQIFALNSLLEDEDAVYNLNCKIVEETSLNSLETAQEESSFLAILVKSFRYAIAQKREAEFANIYKKLLESKDFKKSQLADKIRFVTVEFFFSLGEDYQKELDENIELLCESDLKSSEIAKIFAHAQLYSKAERYDLVAKATEHILNLDPNYTSAAILRFSTFFEEENYKEAVDSMKYLDKDSWLYSQMDMMLLFKQKEYDKCVALFKEQEQKFPKEIDVDDYIRMMIVCEKSANVELFEHCWQKLEAQNVLMSDENIANNVGYVAASLGVRLDEAEKLLKFALSKAPNSAIFLDSMAWVLYRQGRYEEAKEYIEKALQDNALSDNGVIYDHAGDIALKLGNKAEAKTYFQKALKHDDEELDRKSVEKKLEKL